MNGLPITKHDTEKLTGSIVNAFASVFLGDLFLPILNDCIGGWIAGVIVWCRNTRLDKKLGVVDGRLGFNLHVDPIPKIKFCRIGVHHCGVVCRWEESEIVRKGTEAFLCNGVYVSPRSELH